MKKYNKIKNRPTFLSSESKYRNGTVRPFVRNRYRITKKSLLQSIKNYHLIRYPTLHCLPFQYLNVVHK